MGGLPPEEFLVAVDPLFGRVRGKIGGEFLTSDHLAGHLSPKWAEALGLRAGFRFRWGVRRALGRDRVELPRGRRGECGGHVDLHYCHGEEG